MSWLPCAFPLTCANTLIRKLLPHHKLIRKSTQRAMFVSSDDAYTKYECCSSAGLTFSCPSCARSSLSHSAHALPPHRREASFDWAASHIFELRRTYICVCGGYGSNLHMTVTCVCGTSSARPCRELALGHALHVCAPRIFVWGMFYTLT